ncbi:MAG: cell division protein FtsZ [Bacteroidales bacterium]|nr:cell division protein FtsZ [Bacteroidales bacterium]
MDENTNSNFFTFDSPKGQSSYIKVIGVGGGGGNAVNHMYREGIKGVDFIVCNTDMKALNASPVPNKIPLGDLGLGAGNKPERASKAAVDKAKDIEEALAHNTQMLFITAGMGGGTGTGAAPVIAEIAKNIDLANDENKKILVVAIVTRPFSFEGKRRRDQAEAGIEELRKHVDSIIVINNDKLRSFGDLDISEAFGLADDVLLTAAKGIAEIITGSGSVNIDFQDVNTVMERSGTALMGAGSGKGENRAIEAITAAATSVLLDDSDIRGAKNVLLYFSYSPNHKIKMDEIGDITDFILDRTDGTADVIWGCGTDDSLDDELKVTLIATGFEQKKNEPVQRPRRHELEPDLTPEPRKPFQLDDEIEAVIKPAPINDFPQPDVPAGTRRVIPLDDEIPVTIEDKLPQEEEEEKVDALVEEIRLVTPEPKPEPEFKPKFVYPEAKPAVTAPVEEPVAVMEEVKQEVAEEPKNVSDEKLYRSAFENLNDENLTKNRAERIRLIHDMLRNNPNGGDLVQRVSAIDTLGEELYQGSHSSSRESAKYSMRADGTITKNAYFGDQPD